MFDNVIFNVNGVESEDLLDTLKLAFKICGEKARGWKIDNTKGFVLYWSKDDCNPFPIDMNAEEIFPLIVAFLKSNEAKDIQCVEWDENYDHDGSNEIGWRVYTEDWGQIRNHGYCSFLAIKPAYVWYGK